MHASFHPGRLQLAIAACLSPILASAHDHGATQDPHLRASRPEAPVIASPVSVPLEGISNADLARHAVSARAHNTELHCEGVALVDLLRASKAIPEGPLRSAQLARYVQVDGRDGYRVLFSLAEIDPGTGNRAVYVVDRCAGKPLDDKDGPLRLLVPEDVRAARSVRQLEAINVVVAP